MKFILRALKIFTKPVELVKNSIGPDRTIKEVALTWVDYLKNEVKWQLSAIQDLKTTNFQLALNHFSLGNYYDARFRFRMLALFKSDIYSIYYYIGRCYFEEGNLKKSKIYIDKYVQSGDKEFIEEAKYTLNILEDNESAITKVPNRISEHLYDLVAPISEDVSSQFSNVEILESIFTTVHRLLAEKGKPYGNKILDVDCSQGKLGVLCRENKIASSIIGIDLSQKMLDYAIAKKVDKFDVYTESIKTSFEDFASNYNSEEKFDLIFMSKYLLTTSKFSETLEEAHKLTGEKAILAFSAKVHEGPEDFIFSPALEDFKYRKDFLLSKSEEKWNVIGNNDIEYIDGDLGAVIILQKK